MPQTLTGYTDVLEIVGDIHKLLRFGELLRERCMDIDLSLPLAKALDLCWQTMAECAERGGE